MGPSLGHGIADRRADVEVWLYRSSSLSLDGERLPPEEREFTAGLAQPSRAQFISGRTVLRSAVGWHTGVPPGELVFGAEPRGKLRLEYPSLVDLHFNLSHTSGLSVCAVTPIAPVGIDVERATGPNPSERMIRRTLSAREIDRFGDCPESLRLRDFWRLWVLKEACLKATGEGLAGGLSRIEIGVDGRGPPGWRTQLLEIAGDYLIALALRAGPGSPISVELCECVPPYRGPSVRWLEI